MSRLSLPATVAFVAPAAAFMPVHQEQDSLALSDACGLVCHLKSLSIFHSPSASKKEFIKDERDLTLLKSALDHLTQGGTSFDEQDVAMLTRAHNALIFSFDSQGDEEMSSGSEILKKFNGGNGVASTPMLSSETPQSFGSESTQDLAIQLVTVMNQLVDSLHEEIATVIGQVVIDNESGNGEGLSSSSRAVVHKLNRKVKELESLEQDAGLNDPNGKQTVIDDMLDLNTLVSLFRKQHAIEDGEIISFADLHFANNHKEAYPRFKFDRSDDWNDGSLENSTTAAGTFRYTLCGVDANAQGDIDDFVTETNNQCGEVMESADGFVYKHEGNDVKQIRLAQQVELEWAIMPVGVAHEIFDISRGAENSQNSVRYLVNKFVKTDVDAIDSDFDKEMQYAVRHLMTNSDRLIQAAAQGLNDEGLTQGAADESKLTWYKKIEDDFADGTRTDTVSQSLFDYATMISLLRGSAMGQHHVDQHNITTLTDLEYACADIDDYSDAVLTDAELQVLDASSTFYLEIQAEDATDGVWTLITVGSITGNGDGSYALTASSVGGVTDPTVWALDKVTAGSGNYIARTAHWLSSTEISATLTTGIIEYRTIAGTDDDVVRNEFTSINAAGLVAFKDTTITGVTVVGPDSASATTDYVARVVSVSCTAVTPAVFREIDGFTQKNGDFYSDGDSIQEYTGYLGTAVDKSLDLYSSSTTSDDIATQLEIATSFAEQKINARTDAVFKARSSDFNLNTATVREYAEGVHQLEFYGYQMEQLAAANELLGNHAGHAAVLLEEIKEQVHRAKEDADTQLGYALQTPNFNADALRLDNAAVAGYKWIRHMNQAVKCPAKTYSSADKATVCTDCSTEIDTTSIGCKDCPTTSGDTCTTA